MAAARQHTDMSSRATELYTLLHRGSPGDIRFYRAACRGVDQVLELGAGDGRLAVPIAGDGATVTAVDCNADIIAFGQRAAMAAGADVARRIKWLCGDMVEMPLSGQYDRILIAHNTLYCLRTQDDVRACLLKARECLAPGGEILLDFYLTDAFHADEQDIDEEAELVVTLCHEGEIYDVFEANRWLRDEQRLDATYRFVPRGQAETVEQIIEHHYLLFPQFQSLVNDAGLSVRKLHGGFSGESFPSEEDVAVMSLAAGG